MTEQLYTRTDTDPLRHTQANTQTHHTHTPAHTHAHTQTHCKAMCSVVVLQKGRNGRRHAFFLST